MLRRTPEVEEKFQFLREARQKGGKSILTSYALSNGGVTIIAFSQNSAWFTKVLAASTLDRASDEDLCSQLNHMWAAYILVLVGLGISLVQYVGEPIHCWCPAQMPEAHCNYTKALCWIKQNYYVDIDDSVPTREVMRRESEIAYYPWVPWILFSMAVLFKLPHIVWNSCMPSSDLNLNKLVHLADSHDQASHLAKIIVIWLSRTHRGNKNIFSRFRQCLGMLGFFWMGRHQRTYLTGLIMWVKVLYLVVAVTLFFSLGVFLDQDFIAYGYEVIDNFLRGIPQENARFPKQTLCDIKIRQMANIHTYSIQCILPINLYNQRIFQSLWFLLLGIIIANVYSVFKWALRLWSPSNRRHYVQRYISVLHHLLSLENSGSFRSGKANSRRRPTDTRGDWPLNLNGAKPDKRNIRPSARNRSSSVTFAPDTNFKDSLRSFRIPNRSSIETNANENSGDKANVNDQINNRLTTLMLGIIGHDGIVVLHILEDSVGVVIATEVFQELYKLLKQSLHVS